MQNNFNKKSKGAKGTPEFLSIAPEYFDRIVHYSDRRTVWIKLYLDLLFDADFCSLPDETKFHFIGLMMLAAEMNNRIPNNPHFLQQKLSASNEINLDLLLVKNFLIAFKRKRSKNLVASLEKEKKKKQEEQQEKKKKLCRPKSDADFSNNEKSGFSFEKPLKKSIHSPEVIADYMQAVDAIQGIKHPIGFKIHCESGKADREIAAHEIYGDEIFRKPSLIDEITEEDFDDILF